MRREGRLIPTISVFRKFPLVLAAYLLFVCVVHPESWNVFATRFSTFFVLVNLNFTFMFIALFIWAEDRVIKIYLASIMLMTLIYAFTRYGPTPEMMQMHGLYLLGLSFAGLIVLPRRMHWKRRQVWSSRLADFSVAWFMALTIVPSLMITIQTQPFAYDLHILALQDALNLRWVGEAFGKVDQGSLTFIFFQSIYLCIFGTVLLMRVVEDKQGSPGNILAVYLVATFFGYLSYFAAPSIGPSMTFSGYPLNMPAVGGYEAWPLTPPSGFAPRNAMISLHTTWAILICLNAASLRRPAAQIFTFLALSNIAATLALREHWVLDLVPAVPLAIAVHLACWKHPPTLTARRKHVIAMALLVIFWLILVRHYPLSFAHAPWFGIVLIALTVLYPPLMWRALRGKISPLPPLPSPL